MDDAEYKELLERIHSLESLRLAAAESSMAFRSHVLEKLDAILEQTTKTNGRVVKAEGWINRIKGGMLLAAILFSLIGTGLGFGLAKMSEILTVTTQLKQIHQTSGELK